MPEIKLTEKQKRCCHGPLVIMQGEAYTKFGENKIKAQIVCQRCGLVIAHAGAIWINRREAIDGILKDHWPEQLKTPACGFYRYVPKEHRCVEGACYFGDTPRTQEFGNCCAFCPKEDLCDGKCSYMDDK